MASTFNFYDNNNNNDNNNKNNTKVNYFNILHSLIRNTILEIKDLFAYFYSL